MEQGLARAPVGALLASASTNGECAWINQAFTHLTGYTLADVATVEAWLERAHPDPLLRRQVRQEWPFEGLEVVHTVRCADGAVKEVQFRASLQGDQTLVLLLDVTARHRAEDALRRSQERYALAARAGDIGVWELWPRQGRIFGDANLARLMSLEAGEMSEDLDTWLRTFPEEDALAIKFLIAEVLSGEREHFDFEHRARRRDGEERWFAVSGSVVDPDAASPRIVGASRDITRWKRAQRALQESEARYALAQRAAGLASWEWDIDSGALHFSEGAPVLFGAGGPALDTLEALYAVVHPDDREPLREATRACVSDGADYDIEYRVVHPDGAVRWLRATGDALREGGRATRMLGVVSDITDRVGRDREHRQLQAKVQQAQRMESLALLAGGVAHDFNNLLMGILGHADLALLELPPEATARRNIRGIERAAQRAADLARQMLAYSGRGRFVVDQVDLQALVQEMTQLLEASISKKARLVLAFTGGLPAIEADATQLRQVVMNLITNASEALPERGGTVTVSTGAEHCTRGTLDGLWLGADLEPGTYAWLEVSDDGAGMDEATLSRIFDPFFTTKFTGRGLGLAAVVGIVRGHGGALAVESAPGRGTRFRVLFPAPDPRPALVVDDEQPLNWRGRGTILLVDDEETVRTVVGLMLERAGFELIVTRDGREAVEAFTAHQDQVAAVVLDLTMPGMDGEETLRALRAVDPEVQVVLSSGYNELEVAERFGHEPRLAFIQKPYTYDALLRCLRDALGPEVVEE